MKQITALSLVRTGEGLRLSYAYNETDGTGRLGLETLALRHLARQGGAYADRTV